jgi:hypothetical protein
MLAIKVPSILRIVHQRCQVFVKVFSFVRILQNGAVLGVHTKLNLNDREEQHRSGSANATDLAL